MKTAMSSSAPRSPRTSDAAARNPPVRSRARFLEAHHLALSEQNVQSLLPQSPWDVGLVHQQQQAAVAMTPMSSATSTRMERRSASIPTSLAAQKRSHTGLGGASDLSVAGDVVGASIDRAAAPARYLTGVHEYSPDEYVDMIAAQRPDLNEIVPAFSKRPCPDPSISTRLSLSSSWCSLTAQMMTPDTSMSSTMSPMSRCSREPSRHLSEPNVALAGNLGMMRFGSSLSHSPVDHPFRPHDESSPFSDAAAGPQECLPAAFDWRVPALDHGMGIGLVGSSASTFPCFLSSFAAAETTSSQPTRPAAPTADAPSPNARAPPDLLTSTQGMGRQDSMQSNASAVSHACARRRKHLNNAQRQLLQPKSTPVDVSPVATTPARTPRSKYDARNEKRRVKPRQYCDECNEWPNGFRGEHELSRHRERCHAVERRVWMCVEPADHGGITPRRPLSACVSCAEGKHFEEFYNAVAHMRRLHYNPVGRGRKSRASPTDLPRAGSSGGHWPPNDFFRGTKWSVPVYSHRQGERIEPSDRTELKRGPFASQMSPREAVPAATAATASFEQGSCSEFELGDDEHLLVPTPGPHEGEPFPFDLEDDAMVELSVAAFNTGNEVAGNVPKATPPMHWSLSSPVVVGWASSEAFDFVHLEPSPHMGENI